MSRQIQRPREGVRRLFWLGLRGESVGTSLGATSEETSKIMSEEEYVARPIPIIDVEQKHINMRAYIGGVIQITGGEGNVIESPVLYAHLLNSMQCNEDWMCIGERNKDQIFHVHTMARTGVRVDSYKRTQLSIWNQMKTHPAVVHEYGSCTMDMLKGQKVHKPSALIEYMCKDPAWIISNSKKLLQLTYDIDVWDMAGRFRSEQETTQTNLDQANPMVQEILQCIMEHGCKSLEDVIRKGPELVVKHLHKPGFGSIVQNCLTFSKCVGNIWNLKQYGSLVPDPSYIHCILLSQGIYPTNFDYSFWQWITKRHTKRNTIHILGPSNTGKSSLFAGLGKCCPGGEIVNGNNFNFEGLIDTYWGKWEEPLCSAEIAEKCKQIFEGMETAIQVKFKKPYMLPRTPIVITTNAPIWEWCPNQKGPFQNRMFFFEFNYDMSDGIFTPRIAESGCECRYCVFSRGGAPAASCSTASSMQTGEQSTSQSMVTGHGSHESTMGTRSMSERTGTTEQSARTRGRSWKSSSDTTARGSTSSTISRGYGSDSEHGSSSTDERICSTRTGSKQSMESSDSRGRIRHDSRSISGGGTTRCGDARQHHGTNEILPSMVSMGGTRPKKPKMELQIQAEKQQLDSLMASKIIIPGKDEWAKYLSFIYHRYEIQQSQPDLRAYEELESDSE
ncbi:nonstructural protein 1 [Chestnut teal chaphamaparvovirus 1]|uniref:Nonstructural protein 1 n=1 Tax=Chestnut teal chaphamaparvovirus 1 TaxID=2759403 RepID=A0A7D6X6E2_9VIRU|nr:nonstructural protein 1 [Chestnut teal chaphamaparvovirus 1]QMI57829.1 nonstructural protein 1 [Chestnut teal chaphamaparvovirus 1]